MLLLIPGPVTTHPDVRAAMAEDYAPWDLDFRALYAGIRERVLKIAKGRPGEHIALPLQGCGHFALEAAVRTFMPRGAKILVPMTGAYADRLVRLSREAGRVVVELPVPANTKVSVTALEEALLADPEIRHVGLIYSETGSGICHDAPALATAAGRLGRRAIVDAVSAFGALPFDLGALPAVDAVCFTTNKAIEGLPGLSFIVSPIERLRASAGNAESWSFDLADLLVHGERGGTGTSRFTPAAQVIASFKVALDLYEAEGQEARLARYTANMRALYEGVQALGLTPCLPPQLQGPIVVNVHAPADAAWNLQRFVDLLKQRGFTISNFYNTPEPSFRVGCMGAIKPDDMRRFVSAIDAVLQEMGVQTRSAAAA